VTSNARDAFQRSRHFFSTVWGLYSGTILKL
jgi:hypothetical protein